MFCPECGTENPDNARFCGNCRHPLAQPAGGGNPMGPVVELGADPVAAVPSGLKYGVLVATLLIPFIGLVMGILYLVQGESEQKKDVGKLWLYTSIGIMIFYFLISSEL